MLNGDRDWMQAHQLRFAWLVLVLIGRCSGTISPFPLGRNMNGDCDVVTECSSWVSFDDMDPELVTKVHGEKQCKYGYDSVKRCEAVCSLSRYSGVADNVKYECTCVTKQVAQAGLAAQSTTKSWIAGFMLLVGVICTVIACFCQTAAISTYS